MSSQPTFLVKSRQAQTDKHHSFLSESDRNELFLVGYVFLVLAYRGGRVCFFFFFVRKSVSPFARSFVRSLARSLVHTFRVSYLSLLCFRFPYFVLSLFRCFYFFISFVRSLVRSFLRSVFRSFVRSFVLFLIFVLSFFLSLYLCFCLPCRLRANDGLLVPRDLIHAFLQFSLHAKLAAVAARAMGFAAACLTSRRRFHI